MTDAAARAFMGAMDELTDSQLAVVALFASEVVSASRDGHMDHMLDRLSALVQRGPDALRRAIRLVIGNAVGDQATEAEAYLILGDDYEEED